MVLKNKISNLKSFYKKLIIIILKIIILTIIILTIKCLDQKAVYKIINYKNPILKLVKANYHANNKYPIFQMIISICLKTKLQKLTIQ